MVNQAEPKALEHMMKRTKKTQNTQQGKGPKKVTCDKNVNVQTQVRSQAQIKKGQDEKSKFQSISIFNLKKLLFLIFEINFY